MLSQLSHQTCGAGPMMSPLWARFPHLWRERIPLDHPMFLSASQVLFFQFYLRNVVATGFSFLTPLLTTPHSEGLSYAWGGRPLSLFSMIHGWQYGRGVWDSHVSNLWFLKKNMTVNPTLLSFPLTQSALDQWPQKNLSASSCSFHQTDIAFIYSTNIYRISSK